MAGGHLMGEGAREPGLELRFPEVTRCRQIQELGSSFSATQSLPVSGLSCGIQGGIAQGHNQSTGLSLGTRVQVSPLL